MSSGPVRIERKVLRLALTCAAVVLSTFALCLQDAQPQSSQKPRDQKSKSVERFAVRLIRQTPVPRDVLPKWCYDQAPEFIYLDNRSLIRSRLEGADTKLAEFDRQGDNRSLVCSSNGKPIFFLSAQHDRAYIYENEQLAEYTFVSPAVSPVESSLRFGSLMSPDGSTFALRSELQLVRGPDLFKSKRLLKVSNTDVFWTSRYVFYRERQNTFAVLSFPELKPATTVSFARGNLIDGIYECGRGNYILLYSDDQDQRYLARLSPGTFQAIGSAIESNDTGLVSSHATACLVSVNKENDIKVSMVDRLVLIAGSTLRTTDVSSFQFLNDFFSLSKDSGYLVSFQSNLLTGPGGRITVLRVTDPTQ